MLAEHHGHTHGRTVVAHDALDVPRGCAQAAGKTRGSLPRQFAQVARERIERGVLRVLRHHGVEFLGNQVDGFVPGDALELAAAALARALHGVHDARVFVLHVLDVAHGTQARVRIARTARHVARLHADELAIAHRAVQVAARRAVHGAHRVHRLLPRLSRSLFSDGHAFRRCLRAESERRRHRDGADALDERATGQLPVAHEVLRSGFDRRSAVPVRVPHGVLPRLVNSSCLCSTTQHRREGRNPTTHGWGGPPRLGRAPNVRGRPPPCGTDTRLCLLRVRTFLPCKQCDILTN